MFFSTYLNNSNKVKLNEIYGSYWVSADDLYKDGHDDIFIINPNNFFENYIFNHNNYNIIQNFNDSGFFFIYENDFNEISAHHLFTMLNFRNHKDIIIYEAHNNIDKFLNIYTRV